MAHTLQDKLSEKLEEGISSSISATLSDKDDLTADEIAAINNIGRTGKKRNINAAYTKSKTPSGAGNSPVPDGAFM